MFQGYDSSAHSPTSTTPSTPPREREGEMSLGGSSPGDTIPHSIKVFGIKQHLFSIYNRFLLSQISWGQLRDEVVVMRATELCNNVALQVAEQC